MFIKHRRIKEDYSLRIITDTPVDEENVRKKVRNYFIQEKEDIEDIKYAIKRLTRKVLLFILLGIAVLSVWLFLPGTETVNSEILCIIGWVCIWEATEIFIMERPELLFTRYHLRKLVDSDIFITQAEPSGEPHPAVPVCQNRVQ